jgi:ribosomal protein S18 acetylase RimI-like enzyme
MPAIRTLHPDDWPTYRDLRLRALAESPQAFGSTHADEVQRTDDVWAARLAAPALGAHTQGWPFAAEVDGTPVGLAWVKMEGEHASVFEVGVEPGARGSCVCAALVDPSSHWARARKASELRLDVTAGDGAAARLYRRMGFIDVGAPVPMAGRTTFEQAMVLPLS